MKRMMTMMAVLLMAMVACPDAMAIQPEQNVMSMAVASQPMVKVNGNNVHLRLGPSMDADWLKYKNGSSRYVKKGTLLPYLGEQNGFYKVSYAGYELFISKQYAVLQYPAVSNQNSYGGSKVVINGTHVRLRTGPGTNYSYLIWPGTNNPVYLKKGTQLVYIDTVGDFYKVSYNGTVCYISRQYSYRK